jgi:hypothetical protein
MKAPACVRCKWGTGTTSERTPDTVAAKEVKSQFEKMMAERAKQDAAWFCEASQFLQPNECVKGDQTKTAFSPSNDLGNTRK